MRWAKPCMCPSAYRKTPRRVKGFYITLSLSVLLGVLLNFLHWNPIKALYWTAVLNGVVAIPVILVMMLMTQNHGVMGKFTLSPYMRIMGWLTLAVMTGATVGLFATWGN